MKMKTLWGLLPLILMVSYNCSPKERKGEIIYFSGRIANAQTDSIYLLLNNREKAFALDFDGNFSDTLQLVDEGYKTLSIEREEFTIYLVPGDSLVLNTDLTQLESNFKFSGKGKNRNNYLVEKSFKTDHFLTENTELFKLPPSDFKNRIKRFHLKVFEELEKLEVNSSFIKTEKNNLNYDFINLLYTYKDSYTYYNPASQQLPVNFLTELDKIDLDNEDAYRTYQSYRSIVLTNLQEKLYQGFSADALLQEIESQSIKNGFIHSLIYELDSKDPNSLAIYQAIQKHCKHQPWLDEAEKRMKK
ncbi:hypothetical protein HX001_12450 [Empedobacter brevis]|uniref:DUF4369 domain-containing protein n=1 Tax=Empedobacter brevis TaxID=247 RepID=A0AAJ1QFW8_9FLAO|nr:hypothetical protein [Empedobacter brevis]MDM1073293.1 hypothetical protein [Empedobacter brevis]